MTCPYHISFQHKGRTWPYTFASPVHQSLSQILTVILLPFNVTAIDLSCPHYTNICCPKQDKLRTNHSDDINLTNHEGIYISSKRSGSKFPLFFPQYECMIYINLVLATQVSCQFPTRQYIVNVEEMLPKESHWSYIVLASPRKKRAKIALMESKNPGRLCHAYILYTLQYRSTWPDLVGMLYMLYHQKHVDQLIQNT